MGNTEVSIQNLRRTYKELQAQDPRSETSRLEEEYLVSHCTCRHTLAVLVALFYSDFPLYVHVYIHVCTCTCVLILSGSTTIMCL